MNFLAVFLYLFGGVIFVLLSCVWAVYWSEQLKIVTAAMGFLTLAAIGFYLLTRIP